MAASHTDGWAKHLEKSNRPNMTDELFARLDKRVKDLEDELVTAQRDITRLKVRVKSLEEWGKLTID